MNIYKYKTELFQHITCYIYVNYFENIKKERERENHTKDDLKFGLASLVG